MADLQPHIIELATANLPAHDRIAAWREYLCRAMFKVDVEPVRDVALQARFRSLSLPGLHLMDAASSPATILRGALHVADGNDDVVVVINRAGAARVTSHGREQDLGVGEAIILSGGESAAFNRMSHGHSISLRMPRALFEATVFAADDALMRVIPAQSAALRLLVHYVCWLMHGDELLEPGLPGLSVQHVRSLLALALAPAREFGETASTRSVRAARLRAAKSHIARHCGLRSISLENVATTLNVTPRYIQRLFEAAGTTFTAFLTVQRLAQAHRMLCSPTSQHLTVSSIAYEAGFGDLSHFNRCFRRHYGLTPREVRGDRAMPVVLP
jgi:AraC-like DNA-binding protein